MNSLFTIDLEKLLKGQELLEESPFKRSFGYCGYNINLVGGVDVFDLLPKPLAGTEFNDYFVVTDDKIKRGFCSYNFVCLHKTYNRKLLIKLSYLRAESFENEFNIHKTVTKGYNNFSFPNVEYRLEATYGNYTLKGYAMEYIEDSKTYNDFLSEFKTEEEKKVC